jgi:drug/metabolite transporter (DMT)-like permease
VSKTRLPKTIFLAFAALFATNAIWAIAGPVIKLTLEYIPLFTSLFFRFSIVCLILLPFIIIELKKNPIYKGDYFNFFVLGLSSQTSLVLIYAAFKYTSALDATIIGLIGTLISVAAGHYFYKEKVSSGVKAGIIIASIGTLITVIEPLLTSGGAINLDTETRLWGNILALLYNFCFLLYIVWSKMSMGEKSPLLKKALHFIHLKPMGKKYSPFILMGTTFYVGLLTFIPLALLENLGLFGPITLNATSFNISSIFGLLYMAVLSSIVAYLGFEWALHYVTVQDSAIFSYLQPILTVPAAFILLAEVPTTAALVSAAIIGLGVIVAEAKKS